MTQAAAVESDQRRVRFGNLEQVPRLDLNLAVEIWLDDLVKSPWATREAMKLAARLANYIRTPNPPPLQLRELESQLQLTREDINRSLGLMRLFHVITAYSLDKDDVKVALHLSFLQTMRLLEVKTAYLSLLNRHATSDATAVVPRANAWAP